MYHECLVHPALLAHPCPKTVFIAGGGEGSTAREVLRHKTVEKCVMVDIDGVVVTFCKKHLDVNKEAFEDPRLELIIGDARSGLEGYDGKFDVIVGDLADPGASLRVCAHAQTRARCAHEPLLTLLCPPSLPPAPPRIAARAHAPVLRLPAVWGNPCYQLYTQAYYEMCKSKLNPGGVLVTQSGPAGVLSCTEVYTVIHNTLKQVFPKVVPAAHHVPSFADTWGWQIAFCDEATGAELGEAEIDARIAARVEGELAHYDGRCHAAITALSKSVRAALAKEERVYTMEVRVAAAAAARGSLAARLATSSTLCVRRLRARAQWPRAAFAIEARSLGRARVRGHVRACLHGSCVRACVRVACVRRHTHSQVVRRGAHACTALTALAARPSHPPHHPRHEHGPEISRPSSSTEPASTTTRTSTARGCKTPTSRPFVSSSSRARHGQGRKSRIVDNLNTQRALAGLSSAHTNTHPSANSCASPTMPRPLSCRAYSGA